MKKLVPLTAFCILSAYFAIPAAAQQYHSLTPLAGFGPSGSGAILADGSSPIVSAGTAQRGMAYNSTTGHILFVDRETSASSNNITGGIYVLDRATGAILGNLTTNGIEGGTYSSFAIGVADDGTIYMGNLIANSNAAPFKIYRWASENTTSAPTLAYSGQPAGIPGEDLRWGDTMDVRGAGTNTQIIIGSRVSGDARKATLFTTTDGLNFLAHDLATDVADSAFAGGVAFGQVNTFWAKRANLPLRLFNFDLATNQIKTVGTVDMPEIRSHDSLAVDLENGLMAMINFDVGSGNDAVFLYSISNTNDLPQLMDVYNLPINNANNTGISGFLSFGPGRLYAHSVNNGLFAFDLTGALPPPEILTNPAPVTVIEGGTARFRVVAQRGAAFQWRKGTTDLPGETNSVLVIKNVPLSAEGNYSVVVGNATSSKTSDSVFLNVVPLEDSYRLSALWSTAPNSQPYFVTTAGSGNTPNQRIFAYNSFSNHLYVVARAGSASKIFNIHVVDADTGSWLYMLNTNGMSFAGQIGLVGIDVAADGSIYACNADASATVVPNWKLYRWADGNSNTPPQLVFDGEPLGLGTADRWGDAMDVRGGGLSTEVLIDAQVGDYIAILKPTDASLSAFTSSWWFLENTLGSSYGRGLQFGSGNTIWQKRLGSPLVHSSYEAANPMTLARTNDITVLPSVIGPATVDETRKLVGALNYSGVANVSPDKVDLYDISDLTTPVLLSQQNFPINKAASASIGKVVFAGDRMFALSAQNGMMAFRLESGPLAPPRLGISSSGANVTLTWEGADYILEGTTSLSAPEWTTVPHQVGSPNTATEAISGTAKFYRLRK